MGEIEIRQQKTGSAIVSFVLEVMICGAEDTKIVARQFAEVVREFGGDPWHYLSGRVAHLNSANASWEANSRRTVRKASLCVFVILEQYGEITWSVELNEALGAGKPFLLFCLGETYQRYLTLNRGLTSLDAILDPNDRLLVMMMREVESDRQLTIVPFEHGYFKDELRRQMASLFAQTLELLETRNQRVRLVAVLTDRGRLTVADRQLLAALVVDETEEKNRRKRGLVALSAEGGLAEDEVRELLDSGEEGVQRLTIELLPNLIASPVDDEFMSFCVQVANLSDDVGIARRLVPVLFRLDVRLAVQALDSLELTDVGTRRRLASAIEEHENAIRDAGLAPMGAELAGRCRASSTEAGWIKRCEALIRRLSAN